MCELLNQGREDVKRNKIWPSVQFEDIFSGLSKEGAERMDSGTFSYGEAGDCWDGQGALLVRPTDWCICNSCILVLCKRMVLIDEYCYYSTLEWPEVQSG